MNNQLTASPEVVQLCRDVVQTLTLDSYNQFAYGFASCLILICLLHFVCFKFVFPMLDKKRSINRRFVGVQK